MTTSDPVPATYQPRPVRDASIFTPLNRQVDISTVGIRRYFTTDIPVPAYKPSLAMVRGMAGAAVGAVTTPPPVPFITTDPPLRGVLRSDDRIFPGQMGSYDPLAMGAFLTTTIPYQMLYKAADASSLIPSVPPPPPTVPEHRRIFLMHLSYQSPWRQDASMTSYPVRVPPIPENLRVFLNQLFTQAPVLREGSTFVITPVTFSGVAPVVPGELQKFIMTGPPPWNPANPYYVIDVSRIVPLAFPNALPAGTYIPVIRPRRR